MGTTTVYFSPPLGYLNQINTWTAFQTFTGGLALNAIADPASPSAGQLWLSTTTSNVLKYADNAGTPATHQVGALDIAATWSAVQTFGNNISIGGVPFNITSLVANQILAVDATGTHWINRTTIPATAGVDTVSGLSGTIAFTTPNSTMSLGTSGQNVTVDLNLGNANTWTAAQTFAASGVILKGAGAGTGTMTYANSASSVTLTFPAFTDTLAVLGSAQTFTGAITMNSLTLGGAMALGGQNLTGIGTFTGTVNFSSAASIVLQQTTANLTIAWNNPAAARTLTIPDPGASDSFVFLAATQTLTNKTHSGGTFAGTIAGTPSLSGTIAFTNASPFSVVNAQTLTFSVTAQTVGAATLTIPNFAGVADTFAFVTLAQTLSNKTLASPAFSGTSSGTYTLGGTITINAFTLGGAVAGGGNNLNALGNLAFNADNTQTIATATSRLASISSVLYNVYHASADANPSAQLGDGFVKFGAGGASLLDIMMQRVANIDATNVILQSLATNNGTILGIAPNGTSTVTKLDLFATSDITTNVSWLQFGSDTFISSAWNFYSRKAGTGTLRPIVFGVFDGTTGTEAFRITTTPNIQLGTDLLANTHNVTGIGYLQFNAAIADASAAGKLFLSSTTANVLKYYDTVPALHQLAVLDLAQTFTGSLTFNSVAGLTLNSGVGITWGGTTGNLGSATAYPAIVYSNALTAEGATPTITGFSLAGTYNIGGTPTLTATTLALNVATTVTAQPNTAGALAISDGTNAYLSIDTRTTVALTNGVFLVTATVPTIASGAGAAYQLVHIKSSGITLTGTSSTSMDGLNLFVDTVTITDSSAVTVSIASNLYIAAAPAAAGSVTITNSYALHVGNGLSLFPAVGFQLGASSTNNQFSTASAGAGSTQMFIGNASINVTVSSARFKENISPSVVDALTVIDKMQVRDFDYRAGAWRDRGRWTGLIAEEVMQIPELRYAVTPDAVEYHHLVPLLVKAIQEQQQEIKELKASAS